jgi:hypothetical protein
MKPPACVRCKWGTGTVPTGEKPVNSEATKELQTQFERIMAERANQDAKWFPTTTDQTKTAFSLSNDLERTKK